MTSWTLSTLLVAVFIISTYADVYMQNPRGSNNRVNGAGRDRRNANRMFDSENNARGGYNAGGLLYHAGSILTFEWTNQHSCGGPNNNCEIVVQYMCSDKLRNGNSEQTIKFPEFNQCQHNDCDTDHEYGMHEDYEYYQYCHSRERNKGLFTADQDMNGRRTARFTRQDRNGNRHGYECQEEKDYYPYWGPTPWKDIVVMTNDVSRCAYYKAESQNVKPRFYCKVDFASVSKKLYAARRNDFNSRDEKTIPITEEKCKEYEITLTHDGESVTLKGEWTQVPAHDIPAPDCIQSPRSRDNHNGNGIGGHNNMYNWTIPLDIEPHKHCAFRMRYNISTGDMPWETFSDSNGRNKNNQPCKACAINLGDQMGIDEWDAQDRGYILTGNPDILPMKVGDELLEDFELKLAVNTAQFGRTFEDRSHESGFRPKLAGFPYGTQKLYNLNVRGKRGNIVQTYPATEYDFVPRHLHVEQGDAVHFQWVGADTNPGNNAGQGRAQTDRSNIVQLANYRYSQYDPTFKEDYGCGACSYPANVSRVDGEGIFGLNYKDTIELAWGGTMTTAGEMDELDGICIACNPGVKFMKKIGVWRYMCSRNNNFTNRAQKGSITVKAKGSKKDAIAKSSKRQAKKKDAASKEERFQSEKEMNDELNEIDNIEAELRQDLMASQSA